MVSLVLEDSAGPKHSPAFGLDFIAFYTGGTFVNEGRGDQLFNLRAVQAFQRELALQNGVKLGDALGPWWNPPFYAWIFSPLARLSFGAATAAWIVINILCAAAAATILVRMLRNSGKHPLQLMHRAPDIGANTFPASRSISWRTWGLIPVGILLSAPFIQSVTHGQNTGTSLLLVTLIVVAWRAERAFVAGMLTGLLFYKPQLATVLATVLVLSMGWRALAGITVIGIVLLIGTLAFLPGSLGQFIQQMPLNVDFVQTQCVYMWERHATFKAFWRLLIQGRAIGTTGMLAGTLASLCMAAVAVALARVSPLWRWLDLTGSRAPDNVQSRDRLIAATIATTPLLVPFYFDYDLLLLAVPAVLVAREWLARDPAAMTPKADRLLAVLWPALYVWMLVNADIAERTRFNIAVPLLACVASLLITRVLRRETLVAALTVREPLAAAA